MGGGFVKRSVLGLWVLVVGGFGIRYAVRAVAFRLAGCWWSR